MVAGIAVATVIAILLVATIAIYLRQGLVHGNRYICYRGGWQQIYGSIIAKIAKAHNYLPVLVVLNKLVKTFW
jgi:hypothetical protein